MEYISLGNSNCLVSRIAFEVPEIGEACSFEQAVSLVKSAYDDGANFFDVNSIFDDSVRVLGYAFSSIRKDVHFAVRVNEENPVKMLSKIDSNMDNLQTDYIDLLILENLPFVPQKGGADGLYDVLIQLKRDKKINAVGFCADSADVVRQVLSTDFYDVLMYKFNLLSSETDYNLLMGCNEKNVSLMALNPLANGTIDNIPLAFGYLNQFENIIPVWKIETLENIQQILYFSSTPPVIDEKFKKDVEQLRNSKKNI